MQMSVGVDLHKGQFTVYWLSEERAESQFERYVTDGSGYERFEKRLRLYSGNGYLVRVAVGATGNARYFKNGVERAGVEVVVINTLKFDPGAARQHRWILFAVLALIPLGNMHPNHNRHAI